MTDRALQRQIFVGCRQLGLDEDARRDLQLSATGKASLSEMNAAELQLVVNRLKESGFKPVSKGRSKGRHKTAPRADLRFVHVLWRLLGEAGALDKTDRSGLNTFIRTQFGPSWGVVPRDVDDLRDHQKIDAIIQALLAWCNRKGVSVDQEARRR
ncbi:MAG: regulatory protein GemA [Dinoroseobacter sp.]|nr:regulatory protein GemA [Dinoroseobacter sp.]